MRLDFIFPTPMAPLNLEASRNATGIFLEWDEPNLVILSQVSGYHIYRSNDSVEFTNIGNSTDLIFLDTDLEAGKTYEYVVIAFNFKGDGFASNIVSITIPPAPQTSSSDPPTTTQLSTTDEEPEDSFPTGWVLGILLVLIGGKVATVYMRRRQS